MLPCGLLARPRKEAVRSYRRGSLGDLQVFSSSLLRDIQLLPTVTMQMLSLPSPSPPGPRRAGYRLCVGWWGVSAGFLDSPN